MRVQRAGLPDKASEEMNGGLMPLAARLVATLRFDKNIPEVLFSVRIRQNYGPARGLTPRQALRSDLDCEFPLNISACLN